MDYNQEILDILNSDFEKTSDDNDKFIQYAYKYDDGKAIYISKGLTFNKYGEIKFVDLNKLDTRDGFLEHKKIDSDKEMYDFLVR